MGVPMSTRAHKKPTRRKFLKTTVGTAAALTFPTIVPSSVFGQYAPSKRINLGAIGVGRISRGHDMPGIMQYDNARIIAVCDLDAHRVEEGKKLVNDFYQKKTGKPCDGVTGYANYHELLANKDIDAVVISTPDHWHALIAIDAVRAGKDVYLQKPASLTIAEGRAMSNAVQATGRILQIGSQQRSTVQFRYAAELVRNGRIGELQRVEVGLPGDPPGGDKSPMPVPAGFNYDMWLGETPSVYYTVDRVHPPQGNDLFRRERGVVPSRHHINVREPLVQPPGQFGGAGKYAGAYCKPDHIRVMGRHGIEKLPPVRHIGQVYQADGVPRLFEYGGN